MTQVQARTPEVGDPAPDFTLPDTEMQPVSLRDLRGRRVIIAFFPAAFSGVCTKELCTFRDSMGRLNEADAQVLGISVDLPYSLREFRKAQNLQFPLLSDFDRVAVNVYGIADRNFSGFTGGVAMRSVFVVDPAGAIAWKWVAEKQGQQPDYEEILSLPA